MRQTSASRRHVRAVMGSLALLGLTGCASTEKALLRSQIALHDHAIESSRTTLATLQANGGGPGPYDLRIYVAGGVLNEALAAVDNYSFALPDDPSVTVTVRKVRFDRYGTMPAISLELAAKRGALEAEVDARTVLAPTSTPGEFELRVLSFTPRARWSWIEFTRAKFIRDLLAVEVDKLAAKLPHVVLPVEQQLALGGPPRTEDVRFQTSPHPSYLTMRVTYPSTKWDATVANVRYFFLRDGIYVFGAVQ